MESFAIRLLESLRDAPPSIKIVAIICLCGIGVLVIWYVLGRPRPEPRVGTPAETQELRVQSARTGDSAVDGVMERLNDADDSEVRRIQALRSLFSQAHLLDPAEQPVEVLLFRLFHGESIVNTLAEHPRNSPTTRKLLYDLGAALARMQSLLVGLFPRGFKLQLYAVPFADDLEAFIAHLPPQLRDHREQTFREAYVKLLADMDRLLRELDLR